MKRLDTIIDLHKETHVLAEQEIALKKETNALLEENNDLLSSLLTSLKETGSIAAENTLPITTPTHACPECKAAEDVKNLVDRKYVMAYFEIADSAFYIWIDEGLLIPRGPKNDKFLLSDLHKLALSIGKRERRKPKLKR